MLIEDNQGLYPLEDDEIALGDTLPWTVFSADGKLLMREGAQVDSQRKLDMLLGSGYRERAKPQTAEEAQAEEDAHLPQPVHYAHDTNPFTELDEFCYTLADIFITLDHDESPKPGSIERRCYELVGQIQGLCKLNGDALLGAVHLNSRQPYIVQHPLHVAIISALIAKKLNIPQRYQLPMLSAALTQNVGMNGYQLQLNRQRKPLTPKQRELVNRHPIQSVKLLEKAGVTDPLWLEIVLQHHEKIDGSGYPKGLKGRQIRAEARVIALADVYSALVSSRPYRPGLSAQQSLRALFKQRGAQFDPKLTMIFLNELGIYPPGACVKLKSKEIAVVTQRTQDTRAPVVVSVKDPKGELYMRPRERDTSLERYAVVESLPRDAIPHLNPTILWDIKLKRVN